MASNLTNKDSLKKWRKILYEDQNVPDNYVDSTFLEALRKNVFTRTYDYTTLVYSSAVLTQQFTIVVLFVVTWWYMGQDLLSPNNVIGLSLICAVVGYVLYIWTIRDFKLKGKVEDLKTAVIVVSVTAYFAPVLKTLTHTISTDTIYTMCIFMLLGHCLCHDYGPSVALVSQAVSFNMAIFASVCLASRLETTAHTFATVIVALLLFGLWPILRRSIMERKTGLLQCLTLAFVIVAQISLLEIGLLWSFAFLAGVTSVTFIFPFVLVSMQSCKDTIHGPWDEAVISKESKKYI